MKEKTNKFEDHQPVNEDEFKLVLLLLNIRCYRTSDQIKDTIQDKESRNTYLPEDQIGNLEDEQKT